MKKQLHCCNTHIKKVMKDFHLFFFPIMWLISSRFDYQKGSLHYQAPALLHLCTLINVIVFQRQKQTLSKGAVTQNEWMNEQLFESRMGSLAVSPFLSDFLENSEEKKLGFFFGKTLCRCLLYKWIQLQILYAIWSLFNFWLLCKYHFIVEELFQISACWKTTLLIPFAPSLNVAITAVVFKSDASFPTKLLPPDWRPQIFGFKSFILRKKNYIKIMNISITHSLKAMCRNALNKPLDCHCNLKRQWR